MSLMTFKAILQALGEGGNKIYQCYKQFIGFCFFKKIAGLQTYLSISVLKLQYA